MSIPYRADIDGLRALAVLSVVIFHAAPALLPGGFVGVDVFFVISGFLISAIIFKETDQNRFSLASFYERRMRRILPALFVVVLASLAFGAVVMAPADYARLGKSATASAAFYSNFYFAKQVDYFAPLAETQPLLHTWSLAVEEQFYLLAPLILAALNGALRRFRRILLVSFFAASLGAAIYAVHAESQTAFFQPHLRAYEFLVGVWIARGPWTPEKRWMRETMAGAGLAILAASLWMMSSATAFPGAAALAPCIGAALLIAGSGVGRTTAIARFLSTTPAVFVGKISYSLYLWHWPILAFARYEFGEALSPGQALLCITLAFALAVTTYVFVETPWRRGVIGGRKALFVAAFAATGVMVALAVAVAFTNGLPRRLSPEGAAIAREVDEEKSTREFCGFRAHERNEVMSCQIGAAQVSKRSFILWGDSHAGAVSSAFDAEAARAGLNGYFVGRAGCAPLFATARLASEPPRCRAAVQAVRTALEDPDVEEVILVARWGIYAESTAPEAGTRPRPFIQGDPERNRRAFAAYLEETVRLIRAMGKKVSVLGPVPEHHVEAPAALIKALMRGEGREVEMSRGVFDARQSAVLPVLSRLAQIEGVRVLYPHEILCTGDLCRASANGRPLYVDNNHVNARGAEAMSPLIREALRDLK